MDDLSFDDLIPPGQGGGSDLSFDDLVPAPAASAGLGDYAAEFAKGVGRGAQGFFTTPLKGIAGGQADQPTYAGPSPLEQAMAGDPRFVETFNQGPTGAPAPVAERPEWRAAAAIEGATESALAPAPGWEQSWTGDIGSGVGSLGAGILTSMATGPVALGLFLTGGMGEAAERAQKAGATPQQIAQATRLGNIAGATDVVDALFPMFGSYGKALGFVQKVGVRVIVGAFAEGGQEGVQQLIQNAIAKGVYKPDQDLMEDVPRSAAIGAIVGGMASPMTGAIEDRAERHGRVEVRPTPPDMQGSPQPSGPAPAALAPQAAPAAAQPDEAAQALADLDALLAEEEPETRPAQHPQAPTLPPAAPDYVRFYHGTAPEGGEAPSAGGGRWTSPDYVYARDYRRDAERPGQVWYVDIPKGDPAEVAARAWDEIDEAGHTNAVGHYRSIELPEEWAKQMRLVPPEAAPPIAQVDSGQTVPESPATLAVQQRDLVEGRRPVQMFPVGTEPLPLPEGMAALDIAGTGTFHYNPALIGPDVISQAAVSGRLNDILGLGPVTKAEAIAREEAGEPPVVVTERTPDGTEVRAAAGTAATAPVQAQAIAEVAAPGNTVAVEAPEDVIAGRVEGAPAPAAVPARLGETWRTGADVSFEDLVPGAAVNAASSERIATPAVRINGEIFTGIGHFEAVEAAAQKLGKSVDEVTDQVQDMDLDGFLTTEGRYVSRKEANAIALRQGQHKSGHVPADEQVTAEMLQFADEMPALAKPASPLAEAIDQAAAVAEPEPTEAQIKAGNYRKGHVDFQGLDITIENARGSERRGVDPNGKPWSVEMPAHYGYIKRTEGKDGDQVDVYLGPSPDSDLVLVVNQRDADTKRFDEHKVMLGYTTPGAALDAYEKAFSDGRGSERIASTAEMTVAEFKAWLKAGDTTKPAKPVAPTAPPKGEVKAEPAAPEPTPAVVVPEPAGAPDSSSAPTESASAPDIMLARALADRLRAGQTIDAKALLDEAASAHGGTAATGKFDRKDAADALELAVNMVIASDPSLRLGGETPAQTVIQRLQRLLDRTPTQRVRSEEQIRFHQFSTPPHYAAAIAYAANLRAGDVALEPSAGTGSIVAASMQPGVEIVANELSSRRAALLRELVGKDGRVFTENAEQLNNVLPEDVAPTVVVMNPPFSQTAGRMGDKKVLETGAAHIYQALKRLAPGGRLVAIVGRGMAMDAPRFKQWWTDLSKQYDVRANIPVSGKVYTKYGTSFDTRVLVIDKVLPTGEKPVTRGAETIAELVSLLEPIRNARPSAERQPAEPRRPEVAEDGEGARAAAPPSSPEPRGVGTGERGERGVAGPGPAGAPKPSGQPVRVEAPERPDVADREPERPGGQRAAPEPAGSPATGVESEGRGGESAERDLQPAAKPEPGTPAGVERIDVEQAKPGKQAASEITDSLYESYEPRRVRVKGAKKHPGPLVESAAMATVEPPEAAYQPALPRKVIEGGLLSLPQLEAIVYAGQSHARMLPAAEGETAKRRGYFVGDGTGVGKGREIAGIILDNWQQGRTKAVWVSEKKTLLEDAKRDWSGLGQDKNALFDVGKIKSGEAIKAGKGIAFVTYDTLKGGMSDQAALAKGNLIRKQRVQVNGQAGTVVKIEAAKRGEPGSVTVALDSKTTVTVPAGEVRPLEVGASIKSRIDQIAEWFGPDFDGVIAFDEAHNMGNGVQMKGDRGMKDAAQKAVAGMELQARLPNARVVYVSATGATEVSNLAYADRLGLWGRGTPFASRNDFISQVDSGGIAAMELIARDMKQLGLYTARNLSYDGVEYDRIEHRLTPAQRDIYDTVADAWQVVLRNINEALKETGAAKDKRAKAAAMSAFWGGHQRFFNQIITSLQMPSVIKAVEKDIAAGRQAVLQLTNTNEASQERAAAKAESAEEIEDLDITPRDQIIQLVEKSFPTQQYETYVDEEGRERSRPVVDSSGKSVQNADAVRMKEMLIERLAAVRVPSGPLDMVLDHFGPDVVAEVTGRKRRFILKEDPKTGEKRRMEDARSGSANLAETDAFQAGKKKILVFSEAGGTGRSYHADNTSGSKNARRSHYLIQAGWRADKAVQGFGRTHRTNQASAPIVHLVTTDLDGQKRFISSIARRLGQLGALTKGQRQAGDQGIFSARDNLESVEATIALQQFYTDLAAGRVDGVSIEAFEDQTGLVLRQKDENGLVMGMRQDLPPITQFLNRLLSFNTEMQNKVFSAFSERLDNVIEARSQAGVLDAGLETVKADRIAKDAEETVYTQPDSGAETKYVRFTLSNRFVPLDFGAVADSKVRPVVKWAKSPRGKVYAVTEGPTLTSADGAVSEQYRVISPVSGSRLIKRNTVDRGGEWQKIDRPAAEVMWQAETDAAPEFVTTHLNLITGTILPIWDRLKGSTRVVRLQTEDGERYLGRVVPESQIAATLQALGAQAKAVAPEEVFDRLLGGATATLSNGWRFVRRTVAEEPRIELVGPSSYAEGEQIKKDGVFSERINYQTRYFVPTDPAQGRKVIAAITAARPVAELAGGEAPKLSRRDRRGASSDTLPDLDAAFARLRADLDRYGLSDIGLKVSDAIRVPGEGNINGYYWRQVIGVAMNSPNPAATLRHEIVHALRALGLIAPAEWKALMRHAPRWRQELGIDETYADRDLDEQHEEAVAEMFARWWAKPETVKDAAIVRAFKRLKRFLEALANRLTGAGFRTAEDVFEAIESGEIGSRPGTPAAAAAAKQSRGALSLADLAAAIQAVAREQGGFGTVNISDLIDALGKPMAAVHDALRREARAGTIALHPNNSAKARTDRRIGDASITLDGFPDPFAAVTLTTKGEAAAAQARPTPKPEPYDPFLDGIDDEPRFSRRAQTDTPEFRRWFGDSKVVDDSGKPLVVYHGTDAAVDFDRFQPGSFFTTSPREASAYAFPNDLKTRERAAGKYIVASGAELAGREVEYAGVLSDIYEPTIGVVYATDEGVFRFLGKGRWEAFTDVVTDASRFEDDGDRMTIGLRAGDNQAEVETLVSEYEDYVKRTYPGGDNGRVFPVYLSIQNPVRLDAMDANRLGIRLGATRADIDAAIKKYRKQGYDGIVTESDEATMNRDLRGDLSGIPTQYIVFDPKQIKSATGNRGTFDPDDARIKFSRRPTKQSAPPATLPVPTVDPVDLSRFIRGEIDGKTLGPKWEKVGAYLEKSFKPEDRQKIGQMFDHAVSGDPDMLDLLSPKERAVAERLIKEMGGLPPSPPLPVALTGPAEYEAAKGRILAKIVPSDANGKRWPSLNQIYTAIKDDLNPIRVLRDELAEHQPLPAASDPYKLARLTRGSYGKAEQMIESGTFRFGDLAGTGKGLKEILAPVWNDLDGFRAYMAARRVMDLAQRGIRSGFKVRDAETVVQHGADTYAEPFRELVAYQRRVLDYLRDSGVVGPEAYKAMVEANKDYVPFFRLMGGEFDPSHATGRNLKVRDPIKGIKGSDRAVIDPIESIIKNTYLYVSLAEKNRALTALDDLAASSPRGGDFMRAPKRKVRPIEVTEEEVKKFLADHDLDTDLAEAFTIFRPQGFRPEPDQIAFFRGGKREVRQVQPEVAEAVNAMDRETMGLLVKVLAAPARLLRVGATQSPEFIVRNPIRDQFEAFVNTGGRYIPFVDMVLGLKEVFRNGEHYQNWLKAGGANAALVTLDRKYIDQHIMKLSDPTALGRLKNVVRSPIEMLRMLSELMENATRVGVYRREVKGGADPFEAAFESREGTLDFARQGAQTRAVNAIIPFWNASIEGTDRMVRAFKDHPVASLVASTASITLPSVLLWFMNHDDDRYKELPQWQKDLFWIVLTKDNVWRIPKPFTLGLVFGSVPERILDAYWDAHPKAFKNLGHALWDAIIPNYYPQAAVPIIEQFANRSTFTERPIVPKYLEEVLPQYQYQPYTSETAKLLGKGLAKIGLDQSSFSSPLVIDNYIRQWSGGLGQHLVSIADKALVTSGAAPQRIDPTSTAADMPILKAFAVRHPSASAQSIQDFYETYEERKRALETVKHLTKRGDVAGAAAEREARNIETADKIHKALGQQLRFVRDIWFNNAMLPDDKRRLIDSTYLQAIEIAKRGNAMFAETAKAKADMRRSAKDLAATQ